MDQFTETVQFPVSFAQKRLWFLTRLDPDAPFYNIPANVRLHGPLNPEALTAALRDLLARHEILRTTFHMVDETPVQRVHPECQPDLDIVTAPSEGQGREDWVSRQVRAHLRAPFDLSVGPLVRFRLLVLGTQDHILLCTMHHIVSDGWSMGILIRDISELYKAHVRVTSADLPALSIQYGDFADWQAQWLDDAVIEGQLTYWREQLDGAPSVLDLPLDRPRPKQRSWEAAAVPFKMTGAQGDALHALCRQTGATPNMVCLAVLGLLLSRYARSEDIVVGSPVANRRQSEVENLIGFFVNTLVLRLDLSGALTFKDLLGRVKQTALAAFDHQDVPFEQLVEALAPERQLNVNPLFQVSYSFQNAPVGDIDLDGLVATPLLDQQTGMGRFDLEFSFWEEEGLHGAIVYKKDIFDHATIERMEGHFNTLFDALVIHPTRPLADVTMLAVPERAHMLDLGTARARECVTGPLLHERFEAQAAHRPEATALTFEDQYLSYGALNERANQLAWNLKEKGVEPQGLVGVYLERSPDVVIAILAVLKAGGSYLPLEPAYQNDRLGFMLSDSAVEIVLTTRALAERLTGFLPPSCKTVMSVEDIKEGERSNPPCLSVPQDRAYVIYTSGSTGQPKGVEVTHQNGARLFDSTQELFAFTEDDVWTLFHSHAFDFSVWEIWGALVHGARLVIVPYWTSRSPDQFYALLSAEQVTVLNQTPSAFYSLIQQDQKQQASLSLRYVIFGGEALDFRKLKDWYAHHRDDAPRLVNMYGITETTVHASFRSLGAADAHSAQSLIGDPLPDLRFYLLDDNVQPVPYGVRGEIYVGGAGVARGYLNRAELNAQRFVEDPFLNNGSRLYRSGDLARWCANGDLDYCGRLDDQVQIRGFRVELGEIQSLLGDHLAVREAVVLCQDGPSGPEIVAYVVPDPSMAEFPVQAVRSDLQDKLPDYMIPSHLFQVDDIPLTAHGKIDRRTLTSGQAVRLEGREKRVPGDDKEQAVFEVWADLLRRRDFGVTDSFFELGGHSLLATQLVARLQQKFEKAPDLRGFFEAPTIAATAQEIGGNALQGGRSLQSRGDKSGELPLSYAQERLWFIEKLEDTAGAYNIPSLFELPDDVDLNRLEQALNHVIARHEALRTNFVEHQGHPCQVIRDTLYLPLEVVEIADEGERCAQMQAFAHRPFDLADDALLRWQVLRPKNGPVLLAVCIHHIVFDGWSSQVLAREVATSYDALRQGQTPNLDPLSVQYGDFALWQRQRFEQDGLLEEQLAYWRNQLDGLPPVLDMACHKPRPAQQSYRGRLARFEIDRDLRDGVADLARRGEGTDFMVLLGVFALMLGRYSAREDVVVGSPIANRTHRDLEGLIGFFVNTLALRVDLSGEPSFIDLLARVRETALGAYAHQDIPFEKLVSEISETRSLSYAPLFQMMFVLHNETPPEAGAEDTLRVTPLSVDFEASRFDMVFYMTPHMGGYRCTVEYACDLFEADTITQMTKVFSHLLQQAVSEPDRPVTSYRLMDDNSERHLQENGCQVDAGRTDLRRVDGWFEDVVRRQPDACAVVFEDRALSYGALNGEANQLARYLQRRGVGPGDIVGLMMMRSDRLLVALLGILKAGAAYLPIDPDYPPDRVCLMVEDSKTRLVLCDPVTAEQSEYLEVDRLVLEGDGDLYAGEPCENLAGDKSLDGLVYLLYTSGSTGTPKGVAMGHRAMANLIGWHQEDPVLSQPVRTLQFAPFTFDVSFQEVFSTWCNGGSLYIVAQDMRRDFHALVPYVQAHAIERLFMPYVALQQFAKVAGELDCYPAQLRDVISAGEQLRVTPAIVDLFDHLGEARLHNHYGPSETHVVTHEVLSGAAANWPQLPSIGFPIAGAALYLLDGQGQMVAPGVPGEIHVGGRTVAEGYLGRKDLTAQRFIPSPFARDGRLYKTGDLAIWLPDGRLKYLGRADTQVKIRGFRIEPGEVETVLNTHEGVRDCCVVDMDFDGQDKQLVAYLCREDAAMWEEADLRAFVQQTLPDYMVPSRFVVLDKLPQTASGKIDRSRLPRPETRKSQSTALPAALSPLEETLCVIWADVLGCERVALQDNFFEAGGHSLLATQLVSRLRQAFQCEITIRQVFETPVLCDLARALEKANSPEGGDVPPILTVAPSERTVLSFAQERLWFLDRLQGQSANYNMSVAIEITGTLNPTAFHAAFLEILNRHEVLRTNFHVVGEGQVEACIHDMDPQALTSRDLSQLSPTDYEAQIQSLIEENAVTCFDLEKDFLFAGCLVKTPKPDHHIFLLRMHHIVADNWSTGVFQAELAALYEAFDAQDAFPLAPLKIQYGDFAVWQRKWLESAAYGAQLKYWCEQLRNAPVSFRLGGREENASVPAPCRKYAFAFDDELSAALHALCREKGVSLFMGLLAAYGTLLHRYTGQPDFIIGSPIANRNHREIEPLIGFFVNMMPLRLRFVQACTFDDLLDQVRETALGAFAHQDVAFEHIVRDVCPQRGEDRLPLVQNVFVLQNAPQEKREPGGVVMNILPSPNGAAKFDLVFSVSQEEDKLFGVFEYDSARFRPDDLAHMATDLRTLLAHLCTHPESLLSDRDTDVAIETSTPDGAEDFSF